MRSQEDVEMEDEEIEIEVDEIEVEEEDDDKDDVFVEELLVFGAVVLVDEVAARPCSRWLSRCLATALSSSPLDVVAVVDFSRTSSPELVELVVVVVELEECEIMLSAGKKTLFRCFARPASAQRKSVRSSP